MAAIYKKSSKQQMIALKGVKKKEIQVPTVEKSGGSFF
jgi:hypothetical protein